MDCFRIEEPEWVEKEIEELGCKLVAEYGGDTIISDEEYDKWMWDHMSEQLKAYVKKVRKRHIQETER